MAGDLDDGAPGQSRPPHVHDRGRPGGINLANLNFRFRLKSKTVLQNLRVKIHGKQVCTLPNRVVLLYRPADIISELG